MPASNSWGITLPAPFAAPALLALFWAGWTCVISRLYNDIGILGTVGSGVIHIVNIFLAAAIFGAICLVASSGLVISADTARTRRCAKVIGLNWFAMFIANITFLSVAAYKCNVRPPHGEDMDFCNLFSSTKMLDAAGLDRPPTVSLFVFYWWTIFMLAMFMHQAASWMFWERHLPPAQEQQQWPMQEPDLER